MLKKMLCPTVLVCVVTVFAGCQSQSTTNSAPGSADHAGGSATAAPSAKKPVELTFWYAFGGKTAEVYEALVKQFNASQSEIKVTAQYQGASYNELLTKIQTAYVAKNTPDVASIENNAAGILARARIIEDLSPFIDNGKYDLSDYLPSVLKNSYVDGKFYALPYMRSTSILYMNATLLKQAGLKTTGPETWDELVEYARKLTVPGQRFGITMPLDYYRYENVIAQAGGKMISDDEKKVGFDSPEGIASLELWVSMFKEKTYDFPVGAVGDDISYKSSQTFLTQRAAMFIHSSSRIIEVTEGAAKNGFEAVASILPAKKTHGSTQTGNSLAMMSNLPKEKKEAAWTFMQWMTATEQDAYKSAETGYQPLRKSTIDTKVMQDVFQKNPMFKVAADQMAFADPRPMAPAYNEISKILNDQIQRAMLDPNVSPKTALEEAAKQGNALLNK